MTADGIPRNGRVRLGGLALGFDPVGPTPLEVVDLESRRARAPRALCRVTAADDRRGWGWAEWNVPVA